MVISLPKGDVMIDGVAVCRDFKINFADDHRLRCKTTLLVGEHEIPLDLVIYQWETSISKLLTFKLTFNGMEMKRKSMIGGQLEVHPFKQQFTFDANINSKHVHLCVSGFKYFIAGLISEVLPLFV